MILFYSLQVIWEGFVTGILYSLIAFGFALIFKASGVFNFAQGIMVVFAALTLVGLHENGIPAFVALPITISGDVRVGFFSRKAGFEVPCQPAGYHTFYGNHRSYVLFDRFG